MGLKFRKSTFVLTAAGVVIATVAGAIASFAVTGPNRMSTLTASGSVTAGAAADIGKLASNPATQTVTSGATTTWVDSFQNTGAQVSSGQIVKRWDPASQVFVPGSFSTPDSWSRTYTTNGTDWTDIEPAAASIQGVRADAALVPSAGRPGVAGAVTSPTAASISSSISGGGDTYFPFFYNQRLYTLLHHKALTIYCFEKATAKSCGNYTDPRNLLTSNRARPWVDLATGHAYVPGVDRTTRMVVLACVDLTTSSSCGYVDIDPDGTTFLGSIVGEAWPYNGDVFFLYMQDSTRVIKVGCATAATMLPCVGSPYDTGLGFVADSTWPGDKDFNTYWSPDGVRPYFSDGTVRFTVEPAGTRDRVLACFDSVTRAACASFSPMSWANDSQEPVVALNSRGVAIGFCSRPGRTLAVVCAGIDGKNLAVPAPFERWMPTGNTSWLAFLGGHTSVHGTRVYLGDSSLPREPVLCFDWRTTASCAGFPVLAARQLRTYSVVHDPFSPACMWKTGDEGELESYDAISGTSGCASSRIAANPTYCDGKANHVQGWDAIRLKGLVGAHSGFAVTVTDSAGKDLVGWTAKRFASNIDTVSLATIPYAGTTVSIGVKIEFIGLKTSAFVGATPTMELTWIGDPLQACARTTVPTCPAVFRAATPNGVTMSDEARAVARGLTDVARIDLAYNRLAPLSCAVASVDVTGTIAGQHPTKSPGLLIRRASLTDIEYTLENTGTLQLASPTLTDDAGTPADVSDDRRPIYARGDIDGDGVIDPGESWEFTAATRGTTGPQSANAVLNAVPQDAVGGAVAGIGPLTKSDRIYFFVIDPQVTLKAGGYIGWDGGATCVYAETIIIAPRNEKLTYCYTITNAGDTTVTLGAIDDPALGITDRRMTVVTGSLASLAPGASVQLYFQTTNTGKLSSLITASADAPAGPPVTATALVEREVGVPTRPPT